MRSLLVSLVGVAVLVGCSPGLGESPSPSVGVTSRAASAGPTQSVGPSPTPSPTAVASFPDSLPTDDPEKAAVIAGWQEYWRVYEKYAADPTLTDLTETQYVTTGEAANVILDSLRASREKNLKFVGPQQFRDVSVGAISEDAAGDRTAVISYCADNSQRQRLDATTGKPAAVDVPDTFTEQATLKEGADAKWRVAVIRNQEAKC